MTLHYYSSKAYEFVRKVLVLPHPSSITASYKRSLVFTDENDSKKVYPFETKDTWPEVHRKDCTQKHTIK